MFQDMQIPTLPISDPSMFPRAEAEVLGARNLLDVVSSVHTANGTTSGVTIATNSDGTVTFSTATTASAQVDYTIGNTNDGRLLLSDYPSNIIISKGSSVSSSDLLMQVWYYDSSKNYTGFQNEGGSGEGEFLLQPQSGDVYFAIDFRVQNGKTVNTTIKPMLRLASDPNTSWTPYAMTNKQITDALTKITFTTPTITGGTLTNGGYCKIGKLVIVNMRITCTANSISLSGFPTYTGDPRVVLHGRKVSDASYINGSIYGTGNGDIVGTLVSGTDIIINGAYICS